MPPRVGVAIPAYQAQSTLEATLRSCVAQTFGDWVAHVTVEGDDAAAERAIVERVGDRRIRLSVNGRRLGQPWNFNRATLACMREDVTWVKFLSADDVLVPDALERMVALGDTRATCGLVFGYYDVIDAAGRVVARVDLSRTPTRMFDKDELFDEALYWYNPFGGPSSVMVRAEAVERCGLFDDRFPWGMDTFMWFRVARAHDVGLVGDRPVLLYREHANSVTGRTGVSPKRFSDPIHLGVDVALGAEPGTKRWWLAQRAAGESIGSGLMVSAALARRGRYKDAWTGVSTCLRHLTPLNAPGAIEFWVMRLARRARGTAAIPPTMLTPRVIPVEENGSE